MEFGLGLCAAVGVLALAGCGGGSEVFTGGTTSNGTTASGGSGGDTTSASGGGGAGGETASGGGGGTTTAVMTCSGKTGAVGDSTLTLTSSGVERNTRVHVPEKYDPTTPATLVLNFHGYSSNADQEIWLSKMNEASDERGFLVVYPNGLGGLAQSWNAGACCGTSAMNGVDDVGFVKALIEKLEADYCIDAKRVFATGMSNGGFLSNRLGCEMSDTIAAIAPVAGLIGIPLGECAPARPVPVMHFHGTADMLVPYDGGGFSGFISVGESIARWRELNACEAAEVVTFEKGDGKCVKTACAEGSEVTLCTVTNGGHTWPGGTPIPGFGVTSMDLDATNAMLDFFAAHPLP